MENLPWETNFNISYRITVGVRGGNPTDYVQEAYIEEVSTSGSSNNLMEKDERRAPPNAVVMSNLEEDGDSVRGFSFRVDTKNRLSTKAKDSETSTIELFNISDELEKVINQPNCVIIVEAGFEGKVGLAYTGDIMKVGVVREGADMVYRLSCKSGGRAMRDTLVSLSYSPKIALPEIVRDLAARVPESLLTFVVTTATMSTKFYGSSTNFRGKLTDAMDKVMSDNGLEHAHHNGKVIVTPSTPLSAKNKKEFMRGNFVLDSSNLKGIEDSSDRQGVSSGTNKSNKRKLNINTFFIPVGLGQFVTVKRDEYTKKYTGTYKIKGIRTRLSSDASSFDTVLEVEEV